jgi:hypothetical protein
MTFDWNAIYLTCFGVGLVLSVLAFVGGLGHLHLGHLRLGHFGHHAGAHHGAVSHSGLRGAGHAAHMSPINGFTVVAFLCWFGGTGYLLHHGNVFSNALVLLFSAVSGLAGASLIFWFLTRVLMANERTLEPEDTEMTGVVGRLSGGIPAGGVGEILYSQNGARRATPVRSDDGSAMERGAEVIVMRHTRGVAYVRRWDEFEHGLLGSEPARDAEE